MRVAILTMVFNNNTGGMLQAYALQNYLSKQEHEVSILDVREIPNPTLLRKILRYSKRFIFKYILRKNIYSVSYDKETMLLEKNTGYFINKYIRRTNDIFYSAKDFNLFDSNRFDAYVVGSDQVWRSTMYPFIDQAFFGFVKNKGAKKLSYAASFGVDFWEYTEEQTQRFKPEVQQFDAISVRESAGVDMCYKYFEVKAQHVIDPTMLLSVSDYQKLVETENEPKHKGELLLYLLDTNSEKLSVVDKISKYFIYTPFYTNVKSKKYNGNITDCVYPTVTSWLRGFMDAKFVFTDSFHGCVFAILFNIPFIAYGNKVRGLARFNSLLKMFNLENRLILDETELSESKLLEAIDWEAVNKTLETERSKAMLFLGKALNGN